MWVMSLWAGRTIILLTHQMLSDFYSYFILPIVQKCPPSRKEFRELMTKADLAWREIRGLEDPTDSADFVERYSMKVGPRYNVPRKLTPFATIF